MRLRDLSGVDDVRGFIRGGYDFLDIEDYGRQVSCRLEYFEVSAYTCTWVAIYDLASTLVPKMTTSTTFGQERHSWMLPSAELILCRPVNHFGGHP